MYIHICLLLMVQGCIKGRGFPTLRNDSITVRRRTKDPIQQANPFPFADSALLEASNRVECCQIPWSIQVV